MSMTPTGGPLSMRPWATTLPPRRREISFKVATPRQAAGRGLLERFSASRQARIGHEILVRIERLFAGRDLDARRGAVGQEGPALLVVLEVGDHDLIEHLLMDGGVEDRAQRLDAALEIARHHVGGGNVDGGLGIRQSVARAEAVDAAMLEEAAD